MNAPQRTPIVALGEVAWIDRQGLQPHEIPDGAQYLGLEHIEAGGRILGAMKVANGDLESTKFRFGPDHILYGKLRPYLAKIALPDFDGVCSTDILPVRPRPGIDRSYLAHFLRQPSMVDFAASRSTGANLPRLSPKALAEFQIPIPPLEEQKRIAAILDQADALRRLRRRALDRLNTLGQAIFHEMFVANADPAWSTIAVDEVVTNARTGPFGSQLLHSEFVDDGIPVLGIDNVVENRFAWAKPRHISPAKYRELARYTVRPGDVLITIMGTCGRCAVVPSDIPTAINTKHICCLTLDRGRILPEYLQSAFLLHPDVLQQLGVQAKGAVMPGLNMGIIRGLKLDLPPLALQQAYVERLLSLRGSRDAGERCAERLEALFTSLRHRAFRGDF